MDGSVRRNTVNPVESVQILVEGNLEDRCRTLPVSRIMLTKKVVEKLVNNMPRRYHRVRQEE